MKLILTTCIVAGALTIAQADVTLSQAFNNSVQVNTTVNESDCDNSGGPQVTLDGTLSLGSFSVNLILQNNVKGTHTATVLTTNQVTLDLGADITIPKQPVRGGAGGNPHILIQFNDGEGHDLSDEIYLGRCVQGLQLTPELLLAILATTDISVADCSNKGGPFITVGGTVTLSGLHAKIIFRNNLQGTHEADVQRDVTLIVKGTKVTIPKQPVRGGAGGNPIIYVQFLDANGDPVGDVVKLGRCNQI